MFNNFIQWHYFHKGPFNFHNTIYFICQKFCSNRVLLERSKKQSIFIVFQFFVYKKLRSKKINESFSTCKCDAM
jgi:hypothetical protein